MRWGVRMKRRFVPGDAQPRRGLGTGDGTVMARAKLEAATWRGAIRHIRALR